MLSARRLLAVTYTLLVEGLDADDRAELDAVLAGDSGDRGAQLALLGVVA